MPRSVPLNDVEYTGLYDTATGFSGSSTLDSSVDPGSPLPLVVASKRNQPVAIGSPNDPAMFTTSTYDLWDNNQPSAALQLSGVSDPPFLSAEQSTPVPGAAPFSTSAANAFYGHSKFGSAFSILLGNHPQTVKPIPSSLPSASKVLTHAHVPSGTQTAVMVIIVVALVLLLVVED
jgi:hypothetical protein